MKRLLTLLSLATLILFTAVSCTNSEPDSITSRIYDVSDFSSLNLELIGDIIYEQSDSSYLTASGSSNLIDALKISDSRGKLSIELSDSKQYSDSNKKLEIRMGSPKLNSINLKSIGQLHIKNHLESDELEITNKGIGTITIDDCHVNTFNLTSQSVGAIIVKGTANDVFIESEGVGSIDCAELKSKNAEILMKGAGDLSIYAQESIDITLKGVGNVNYYGNPSIVKTDVSGMGKAKSMD